MDFPTPGSPNLLDFQNVLYQKVGARATVTINRPEMLNCLDFPTLRELHQAFEDVSWDDTIRVMVLTGAAAARVG